MTGTSQNRRGRQAAVAGSALVALLLLVSCDKPTDPTPLPPLPPTPVNYRLTGIVIDATSAAPVPGAVLEARFAADQSAPSVVRVAGADGRYSFDSLPSLSYVRVTQYGYVEANERVELTADGTRNFNIARNPSVPDLNGAYTLTIEADDACPSAPNPLPPELRLRTFPARIERVDWSLTLHVGCEYGQGEGCRIAGLASNGGATFSLGLRPDDFGAFGGEDLLELVTINRHPGQHLAFLGTATTNFTPTGLLGSLGGTITLYPFQAPPGLRHPSAGACRAGRFELTRR